MSVIDQEERQSALKRMDHVVSKELRLTAETYVKEFKTSWLQFSQALYSIHQDRLYEYWGYEKFEHYVERELGLKKSMAIKLVKTYAFVEQQEPSYLRKEFLTDREAKTIPDMDAISVLRLAKNKKEITKNDYQELRKKVFDQGRSAGLVRKDLTTMMRERQTVDPQEERERRHEAMIRRLLNAIRSFKKDAASLKLVKADLVQKAEALFYELESEIDS